MSDEIDTARGDLVFLKALVTEGGTTQATLGAVLFAAGTIYGVHALGYWLIELKLLPAPQGLLGLAWAMLPTVLFLIVLSRVIWLDRKTSQHGIATRALNAAFGGVGLASLTTATIFGYVASQRQDLFIWLFHPIMAFVLQGTGWYVAWAIRRRWWFALVSLAWHASAIGLAVLLQAGTTGALVLVMALGLLLLMALPGWILWRGAKPG